MSKKLLRSFNKISILIISLFLFIFLLILYIVFSPPYIKEVQLKEKVDGFILNIQGYHFRNKFDYLVFLGEQIISSSDSILTWNDKKIQIYLPQNFNSNYIFLSIKNKKSNQKWIINPRDLPSPQKKNEQNDISFDQKIIKGNIGQTIRITGSNFHILPQNIFLNWGPIGDLAPDEKNLFIQVPEDLIQLWSYDTIIFYLPSFINSGSIILGENSSSIYTLSLTLKEASERLFSQAQKYIVEQTIQINMNIKNKNNALYIWIPTLHNNSNQKLIEQFFKIPPFLENYQNFNLYKWVNLNKQNTLHIQLSSILYAYQFNNTIKNYRSIPSYNQENPIYQEHMTFPYTGFNLDSSHPLFKSYLKKLKSLKHPFLQTKKLYQMILDDFQIIQNTSNKNDFLIDLDTKEASSAAIALFFKYILSQLKIPSRLISGFVFTDLNNITPLSHMWNEVYFETIGWFPIDLFYAQENPIFKNILDSKEFYFGNLDNLRLSFKYNQKKPNALNTTESKSIFSLNEFLQEESYGLLYTTQWDLKITTNYLENTSIFE